MATSITSIGTVPYISSGVYFREIDLTVVTQATGGFSAAAIGLTEKGPAFQITNSSTYTDRAFRLGDLNPDLPMSYYARQYLEQARNYKEVRLLGLEGYNDIRGWAVCWATSGSVAAVPGTSPLAIAQDGLVVVMKERPTALTGRPAILSVVVQTTTYIDPNTGLSTTGATDFLFNLLITYVDTTTDNIVCSLRPESIDYIGKKLWKTPFEHNPDGVLTFPLIKSNIIPLWVDFIIPSVQTKPSNVYSYGYYYPNTTVQLGTLPVLTGDIRFGTGFTYASFPITTVTAIITSSVVVGTRVQVTGDITSYFTSGVSAMTISGVTGTGNITLANGTWGIYNISFNSGVSTFELLDLTDLKNSVITPIALISGSAVYSGTGGTSAQYIVPTWEPQVLNYTNLPYQTPVTPWFVSDGDSSGDYQRLFRFFSISDGRSANTEIKVEINSINPTGNNGTGSFNLVVREWDDSDDVSPISLETYSNLSMDPTNDNYILRRIGNGEDFPLRSRFILIEMNLDEQIPVTALPWGCLGYPNTAGKKLRDLQWTLEYDKTRPIPKQRLGLAKNNINMYAPVTDDQLALINGTVTLGLGFHLNPNNNTNFATDQAAAFSFANQSIYTDSNSIALTPQNKVARQGFVVDFYGGFDGWNVYKERQFGNPASPDYQSLLLGLSQLNDRENIDADFTVLTTPDFFFDTDAAACEAVLEMVQSRGDCLYIPDLSYDAAADPQNAVSSLQASDMQTNATAVYFPWLQIQDDLNKVNVWLPPSLLALGTITYTAMNENIWQPPGGAIRTVTNNLVRSRRRLMISDREILAAGSVNPITLFPGSGYEITAVRTTQTVFSALSFIHNRLLLCYAKKALNQILRPLLFQLNSTVSQQAFINTVTPIFDRIKKLNGIDDFKVSLVPHPELNDPTTMYGQIEIIPLYPIERIIVDFVLENSTVSFNQ